MRYIKLSNKIGTRVYSSNKVQWLVALIVMILLVITPVLAQSTQGYDLSWNTVDSGGGSSEGGGYSLGGTAGQPDAGTMSGGVYSLSGGFSPGGTLITPEYFIHLPLVANTH
jgi:uncharacterized membrane protein